MQKIKLTDFSKELQPRTKDSHKGLYGHVLVIGGDVGFSGATRLAAEAALRVGAGLVSVATHPAHAASLNATRPEIMCHPVKEPGDLTILLQRATVIALGPGLGQNEWGKKLFNAVVESEKALVIDADGLNLLAEKPHHKTQWILTPHPGEAARLLRVTTEGIQRDRIAAIQQLQQRFGGVIVLKGAGTLVLGEKGEPAVCSAGNPGMSTAGMGDVLTGVIAGLAAQHVPLETAAKLGVILHATAGDDAAKEGERGMIASDLMPYLRRRVNT